MAELDRAAMTTSLFQEPRDTLHGYVLKLWPKESYSAQVCQWLNLIEHSYVSLEIEEEKFEFQDAIYPWFETFLS